MHAIGPSLDEHGLMIYHTFEMQHIGGANWLACACVVTDGESEHRVGIYLPTTTLDKSRNAVQEAGKLYTYARRYSIAAMFNLTADEDTDAHIPSQHTEAKLKASVAEHINRTGNLPKPFVDSEAAWKWLNNKLDIAGITDQATRALITSTAVGKLTTDLDDQIKTHSKKASA